VNLRVVRGDEKESLGPRNLNMALAREFCTGSCEDRTSTHEIEEPPLFEAVAREWLVKTTGWKILSGCCG
jgi:hypothetical protein